MPDWRVRPDHVVIVNLSGKDALTKGNFGAILSVFHNRIAFSRLFSIIKCKEGFQA